MQIAGEFGVRSGGGFAVRTPGGFAANTQSKNYREREKFALRKRVVS